MTTTTTTTLVMIDARQPELLDHLGYDNATVLRTSLQAGSLNVLTPDGTLLVIERVPVESMAHAVRTGTLIDRCAAMRQLTSWAYLIIVGDLMSNKKGKAIINGKDTGWDWRSMQGALATVQELGVIVLSCANDDRLSELVVTLAKHERGPARLKPVREALFITPDEALLLAIPGIGEAKVAELLAQSGSAALALISLSNPAYALPGIGPKTIAGARQALGLPDGANLCLDYPTPTKEATR